MCEERVEDAQVGVAEGGGGEGQVEEVADHDVDEDAEVVGVEVFVGCGCGEDEVEELEDKELEGGFACKCVKCQVWDGWRERWGEGQTFAVQEEDDVFAEGFAGGAVKGEDLDHLVCELGGRGLS